MLHLPRRPISVLLRANLITAGSKTIPLLRSAAAATLYRRTFTYFPIRPTTGLLKSSRFHSPRPLMFSTSANCQQEVVEKAEGFELLKSKLEKEGIDSLNLKPGKEHRLLCPKCGGGSLKKRSCSLFVCGDGQFAKWHCFRAKCGSKGLLEAFGECKSSHGAIKIPKAEGPKAITEEELQPLSMELMCHSARLVHVFTLKDTKFQFLCDCRQYLDKVSRIILATDAYLPGQALAEEIARCVGKQRCWRVSWPKNCKDANEVLMFSGRDALKEVIENAELYPIRGFLKFSDFFPEIDAYYHRSHGYELGVSTGWTALDAFYRVIPGELTIISGVPNSGKSEWIDALLCNLNASEGWKFVLCSMENNVREHARKLLEKHYKKPFLNASHGESVERMSVDEFEEGKKWLDDTFALILSEDDCLPSIAWVLSLANAAVLRYGVRGLVIDSYNTLDHQRPVNQTETEYVSQMLTKIKRFAQHHACHVWFVAHPKQLQQWGGGPPNLYDISRSAHFINKCDNCIVIHRNRDENAGPMDQVQVCVRKVRNKVAGKIGDAYLKYNRVTGEFKDMEGGFALCKPQKPRQLRSR